MPITDNSKVPAVDIPDDFCCPILQTLFQEPVVASDGYTYEKDALLRLLEASDPKSPLTGEPFESKQYFPNHAMRSQIASFLETKTVRREDTYLPQSYWQQAGEAIRAGNVAKIKELIAKDPRLLSLSLKEAIQQGITILTQDIQISNLLDLATELNSEKSVIALCELTEKQAMSHMEETDVSCTSSENDLPDDRAVTSTPAIPDEVAEATFDMGYDSEPRAVSTVPGTALSDEEFDFPPFDDEMTDDDRVVLNEELVQAAFQGNAMQIQALLQQGADVNYLSVANPTSVLQLVLRGRHSKQLVELVLEAGVDLLLDIYEHDAHWLKKLDTLLNLGCKHDLIAASVKRVLDFSSAEVSEKVESEEGSTDVAYFLMSLWYEHNTLSVDSTTSAGMPGVVEYEQPRVDNRLILATDVNHVRVSWRVLLIKVKYDNPFKSIASYFLENKGVLIGRTQAQLEHFARFCQPISVGHSQLVQQGTMRSLVGKLIATLQAERVSPNTNVARYMQYLEQLQQLNKEDFYIYFAELQTFLEYLEAKEDKNTREEMFLSIMKQPPAAAPQQDGDCSQTSSANDGESCRLM